MVDELFAHAGNMNPEDADVERERSYVRAMEVEQKLGGLMNGLEDCVSDLNASQERMISIGSGKGNEDGGGDIAKILQILNAHHDTLSVLESTAKSVENDVGLVGRALAQDGVSSM
eukprot:10813350-Ditylum_brightwellii.AAC.1